MAKLQLSGVFIHLQATPFLPWERPVWLNTEKSEAEQDHAYLRKLPVRT